MNKNNSTESEEFRKGKEALGKIGFLILNFALVFSLFRFIILLSEKLEQIWIYYVGMSLFAAATVAVFLAFFILNGYTFKKEGRAADELPDGWTDEEKASFIEKQPARRKKARRLIYVMFALVLTFIIDFIGLYFIG